MTVRRRTKANYSGLLAALALALSVAAACTSRTSRTPGTVAARTLPTIADLALDSAARATFPGHGVGPDVTVSGGGGMVVPPKRQAEARYTAEFRSADREREIVEWLDKTTEELLRRRGAHVTTAFSNDKFRSFWFETSTTVGWMNIVARDRREDGFEQVTAAGIEFPRSGIK